MDTYISMCVWVSVHPVHLYHARAHRHVHVHHRSNVYSHCYPHHNIIIYNISVHYMTFMSRCFHRHHMMIWHTPSYNYIHCWINHHRHMHIHPHHVMKHPYHHIVVCHNVQPRWMSSRHHTNHTNLVRALLPCWKLVMPLTPLMLTPLSPATHHPAPPRPALPPLPPPVPHTCLPPMLCSCYTPCVRSVV